MVKLQGNSLADRDPSASETIDQQLLLRYRDHGDAQAFEQIVQRHERPIYNYLLRYLRNAQLAEEVFQATFLRLHEKCHLYQEDRPFRPWLYSMATNRAVDTLRKEGRQQAVSLDEEHGGADDDARALVDLLQSKVACPSIQLAKAERRQWTREAVGRLPEHLRAVVLLIYFQGMKYREVAEVLDIPLGTVKSRANKALVRLNSAWRRDHTQEGRHDV
jgi:RNA polymerase sigma-70 factor (ECF subfamily)